MKHERPHKICATGKKNFAALYKCTIRESHETNCAYVIYDVQVRQCWKRYIIEIVNERIIKEARAQWCLVKMFLYNRCSTLRQLSLMQMHWHNNQYSVLTAELFHMMHYRNSKVPKNCISNFFLHLWNQHLERHERNVQTDRAATIVWS